MTAYAGNALDHALFANNGAWSIDLRVGKGGDLSLRPLVASEPMSTGVPTFNEPIAIEHVGAAPISGGKGAGVGDFIFERIHVLPSLRNIPFILSSQHVIVEVWNAYREQSQTAASVVPTGPAGVSIVSGGLSGVVFAPMESKLYDVLISAAGAPRADNTITFDFGPVSAPVFYATGLRLLPFTIAPDWSDGIDEALGYLTDVMAAYDTTEQRMQLREIPTRQVKYTAMAIDAKESALLMALLYAWQGRSYGVLIWQRAAPLGFTISAGEQDLVVDTTFMDIAVGETVILISDAFRWFASTVEAKTAGTLRLASGVDRDFSSSETLVVPVVLGRVAETASVLRPTNASAVLAVAFDVEVVPLTDSAPLVLL
jgi:hypothetical protein